MSRGIARIMSNSEGVERPIGRILRRAGVSRDFLDQKIVVMGKPVETVKKDTKRPMPIVKMAPGRKINDEVLIQERRQTLHTKATDETEFI